MRNILFISLLLIITLASCSPSTALPSTVINSTIPTAKIVSTSADTSTQKPSATIAPPISLSETPPPTTTPQAFKSLVSPNGEFIANAYSEYQHPSGIQTIEIRNKKDELIWQVPYQGEQPTGDPSPLLYLFQWSNDSSQLYFYYILSPDGGERAFWWTGYDLQKIDIKTGDIQSLLPGKGFMSFKISPDGTLIAYIRSQDKPSIIYIRNLSTGSEKTAYVKFGSKNYALVGDIHWSATGKELAYQTQTDDFVVQTIYLDTVTMNQKVIREYHPSFVLLFNGWADNRRLQFSEISADGWRYDEVFQIDVLTSEMFIIGTPTPNP